MEARDMSLVEKAYNGIAEMIFSFQLPPGSKVSDFSLSRKLGISRTPIRSAILLLMNHGLVIKTHDGYEVPKITAESIDEIYDARICIETAIVDFSIRNNLHCKKIKELRRLISLQKSAADSGDIFQSTDYSLRFHKALVGMCENESLEDLFSHLYLPMKIINVLALARPNLGTGEEYTAICDAVERGDSKSACRLLTESIEKGRCQKKEVLEKYGALGMDRLFGFIAVSSEASRK